MFRSSVDSKIVFKKTNNVLQVIGGAPISIEHTVYNVHVCIQTDASFRGYSVSGRTSGSVQCTAHVAVAHLLIIFDSSAL